MQFNKSILTTTPSYHSGPLTVTYTAVTGGGCLPYTYLWERNICNPTCGAWSTLGATGPEFVRSQSGAWPSGAWVRCTVTDANGDQAIADWPSGSGLTGPDQGSITDSVLETKSLGTEGNPEVAGMKTVNVNHLTGEVQIAFTLRQRGGVRLAL